MSRTEDIVNTSLSVTLRGTGGDKDRDAASVWKEGLNCAARVLALSVSSQKWVLICVLIAVKDRIVVSSTPRRSRRAVACRKRS